MPRETGPQDQNRSSVTYDGRTIRGLADGDDAVTVGPEGTRSSIMQGVDRQTTLFSSVRGGVLTMRVMANSPDAGFLLDLFELQKTQPRTVQASIASASGEVIRCNGCSIASIDPTNTATRDAVQTYTFNCICEELIFDRTQGEFTA